MIDTTMYSISANFFPEDKEKMIGMIEAMVGFGYMFGPMMGSALYTLGGYTFIFYTLAGIFILQGLVVNCVFPQFVDEMNPNFEKEE